MSVVYLVGDTEVDRETARAAFIASGGAERLGRTLEEAARRRIHDHGNTDNPAA